MASFCGIALNESDAPSAPWGRLKQCDLEPSDDALRPYPWNFHGMPTRGKRSVGDLNETQSQTPETLRAVTARLQTVPAKERMQPRQKSLYQALGVDGPPNHTSPRKHPLLVSGP